MSPIVTFDVFSALTDSRAGGSVILYELALHRGWPQSGFALYDRWDYVNKEMHRAQTPWIPFREISAAAFEASLTDLGLSATHSRQDSDALLDSVVGWPLWPDVTAKALQGLDVPALGLLSNIDDELLRDTAAVRLGVFDPKYVLTSERLRAYKPNAVFYRRAGEVLGPFTHVAASARDVRGALDARISCVRLARPGHALDLEGPIPSRTAGSIGDLSDLLLGGRSSAGLRYMSWRGPRGWARRDVRWT